MSCGNFGTVSHLLREESDLKIEELSKQFVRDILLENGGSGGKDYPI